LSFKELRLAEPLTRAVMAAGYTTPTPIQIDAIPAVLAGRDVMGLAQTGTGKTAAFALPMIQRLLEGRGAHGKSEPGAGRGPRGPRALVLSPTRELAQQVGESFATYGRFAALRTAVIVGGVSQQAQVRAMRAGADVLVATPGRLIDLMGQQIVPLGQVEMLVLDEADRMLDVGFLPAIRRIMAQIPKARQTLMFSATMPPAIAELSREILRNPVQVQVAKVASAEPKIEHWVHFVEQAEKPALLTSLLREDPKQRTLVFTRTKRGADRLVKYLERSGLPAAAMHGNKGQGARMQALANFRSAQTPVLIATDIAARGLHVDDIARVINYDLTTEPETYVHRAGRTGRAGASGIALSFCTSADHDSLRAIERLLRSPLKRTAAQAGHAIAAPMPGSKSRKTGRPAQGSGRRGIGAVHARMVHVITNRLPRRLNHTLQPVIRGDRRRSRPSRPVHAGAAATAALAAESTALVPSARPGESRPLLVKHA